MCYREKSSLFPLLNPDERASCTNKNIDDERPVFINPCKEEPKNFIRFNEENLVGIDDEGRGQRTLDELNLNNESLRAIRRRHLDSVNTIIKLVSYILMGVSNFIGLKVLLNLGTGNNDVEKIVDQVMNIIKTGIFK